jgi:hypothetical protein
MVAMLRYFMAFIGACLWVAPALAANLSADSAQLRRECDALLSVATVRGYGIAWDEGATAESGHFPKPRVVAMGIAATPAAGLALLWAGRMLNEPRYRAAAERVARAVIASETGQGRVHPNPVFGPSAGGRDDPEVTPDRASSTASLGLFLGLMEAEQPTTAPSEGASDQTDEWPEMLRGGASRLAFWLARQQAPNGFWPSTFPSGPWTKETVRIIRLDSPDYRDSTLGMLVAFDLLHDEALGHLARQPLDGLLHVRLAADVHAPSLWCCACTVNAVGIPDNFPKGPDVSASRYAMQTMLCAYLMTGDRRFAQAFDEAAETLAQSARPDGSYDRFLNPAALSQMKRVMGKDSDDQPRTFFAKPTTTAVKPKVPLVDLALSGSFDVPELEAADARLRKLSLAAYRDGFAGGFSLHEQIEASLCGLMNDPGTFELPVTAGDVRAWMDAHQPMMGLAQGPVPDGLSDRVRRLWALLVRVRVDKVVR